MRVESHVKISRLTVKERNLVKGALRRVFSRSDLRRQALAASVIPHTDPARPRVTKWSRCSDCQQPTPSYLIEIDHVQPIVPVHSSLQEMTWDDLVERLWCDPSNLRPVCKPCHKIKTKLEAKERLQIKKLKSALKAS